MTARSVPAGVKTVSDLDLEYDPATGNRGDVVEFADSAGMVRVLNRDGGHPQPSGKLFFTLNGEDPVPRQPGTFEVRGALHAECTVPAPPGPVTVKIVSIATVPVRAQNSPWPSGYGSGGRRYAILLLDDDSSSWPLLPPVPVFPDGYV